jgi:hypothetical protein
MIKCTSEIGFKLRQRTAITRLNTRVRVTVRTSEQSRREHGGVDPEHPVTSFAPE